ncbi:MAG: outer membrane beta-barrel protein [Arcobacter sp.]|jgi:opacity protein-like surface antigen|uniref:outer membrane beta-barrel protein n=1 Tax=Arcobacter sp. TaxID=1872629 RepID=UPI002A761696|nr:outer membrane beta-barrel protein [Arcobacter sp.]MDY3203849.1 outer membrane beta-barrel protein [Arcobacter sp.]
MKKLALVAFSVSTLLLSNVSAKETLMDIHLVGISSTAANIDSKEIGIGYGVSLYLDNSIFWGLSFDFSAGKLDNSEIKIDNKTTNKNDNIYTAGADFKLGYALFDNKLALYGIGSGIYQSIGGIEGAGLGYGAGVDYRITNNIALNLEYKTYSMTSNYGDYDYDRVSSGIKYNFK